MWYTKQNKTEAICLNNLASLSINDELNVIGYFTFSSKDNSFEMEVERFYCIKDATNFIEWILKMIENPNDIKLFSYDMFLSDMDK